MNAIFTAIAFLVAISWLAFLLFLLKRCKPHQKKILLASAIVTSLLFWYDDTHDDIPAGMTITDHIIEVVLAGTIYITIIFLLISGVRLTVKACTK